MKKILTFIITCCVALCYTNVQAQVTATCGESVDTGVCYSLLNQEELISQNICPSGPNEFVTITLTAGTFEGCCDELSVYQGGLGSGNTGTLIFDSNPGADATGTTVTSTIPGVCLHIYVDSDVSVTCSSLGGTPISFDVTCSGAPPAEGCESPDAVTPICTDTPVTFAAGVDETAASVANPNVNYDCLGSSPNPAWFYLEIEATGTLAFDISNSNGLDVDWAAWGPFTDLAELNTNCAAGASPFDATLDCDYTTAPAGVIDLGSVTAGDIFAVLVTNFSNSPTDISMSTTATSTATTDCSILPPAILCAQTCADVATDDCGNDQTYTDAAAQAAAGGSNPVYGGNPSAYAPVSPWGGDGSGTGCQSYGTFDGMSITGGLPTDGGQVYSHCSEWTATLPDAFFPTFYGSIGATGGCFGTNTVDVFDAGTCVSVDGVGGVAITQPDQVNSTAGQVTGLTIGTTYRVCVTADWGSPVDAMGAACTPTAGDVLLDFCNNIVEFGTPPAGACEESYTYTVEDVCSGVAPTFLHDAATCMEGPNNELDLDWYMYAPGGVPSMAPANYDPLAAAGGVDNTFPMTNTDMLGGSDGLGGTWNGIICADLTVSAALTVTNNTCAPIVVTYFAMPWDRALDTDMDGTLGEYNNVNPNACPITRYEVTIYPAPMSVVVTDDGATCGTPTVELQDAAGNTCETLTGAACVMDGDEFTYNFDMTPTVLALGAAPAACALPPTLTGTITCAGCVTPPAEGCEAEANITPICTDEPVSFPAGVDETDASIANPAVNYDCLGSSPNPAWFYLTIDAAGTLSFDITNSNGLDIDWAAWGPFADVADINASCGAGAAPFDNPLDCDYTVAGTGVIDLGTVAADEVYVVLVTNFSNAATDVSMATTAASTAMTDCSVVAPACTPEAGTIAPE